MLKLNFFSQTHSATLIYNPQQLISVPFILKNFAGSAECRLVKLTGPGCGPTSTLLAACVEHFARIVPSEQAENYITKLAFSGFCFPICSVFIETLTVSCSAVKFALHR